MDEVKINYFTAVEKQEKPEELVKTPEEKSVQETVGEPKPPVVKPVQQAPVRTLVKRSAKKLKPSVKNKAKKPSAKNSSSLKNGASVKTSSADIKEGKPAKQKSRDKVLLWLGFVLIILIVLGIIAVSLIEKGLF